MDSRLIFLHLDDFLASCTLQKFQPLIGLGFLFFKDVENVAEGLQIGAHVVSRKGLLG